jgi:glycine hydroxymethyltransferase
VLAASLIERGFQVVSGGTDNHLMLIDLRNRNLTGKVAEKSLDIAGITVNKNTVPKETQSPFITSGIRLGTPAVTTRGLEENEMRQVAELIDRALAASDNADKLAAIRADVTKLASRFPLYPAQT